MSDPEKSPLDEFWAERFEPLRQEIVKALLDSHGAVRSATDVDAGLAIMPFDHSRYRYCRGLMLEGDARPSPKKKLFLPTSGKPPKGRAGFEVGWDELTNWVRETAEIEGDVIESYAPGRIAKLCPSTDPHLVSKAIALGPDVVPYFVDEKAKAAWEATSPDFDLTWLGDEAPFFWKLRDNVRLLLRSDEAPKRQQAYDVLTTVHFPSDGISAPSPEQFSSRSKNFRFVPHTSFRPSLGIAYYLDALAFPFGFIASWPVWSYQPSAWIMVTANFDDRPTSRSHAVLRELTPRLQHWERETESELFALRLHAFHQEMAEAYSLHDIAKARTRTIEASKKLFHRSGMAFWQKNSNHEWEPIQEVQKPQPREQQRGHFERMITFPVLPPSDQAMPAEDAPLSIDYFTKDHDETPIPVLEFDERWHTIALKTQKPEDRHRAFLLEHAYRQLLNQSRLVHAVVERNTLAATASLANFLTQPDTARVSAFMDGLREVVRAHERLSAERPLGSDRLHQLCLWLGTRLEGGVHQLYDASAKLKVNSRVMDNFGEVLQDPRFLELVLALRQDLREGRSSGLVNHLLLRPLAPTWVGSKLTLFGDMTTPELRLAITAGLLKAWGTNALWLPHLYLLRKPCPRYGEVSAESDFIQEAWGRLEPQDFKTRLKATERFEPVQLLGVMKAFADLCAALRVPSLSHCEADDSRFSVTLVLGKRKDASSDRLREALATATTSASSGNVASAAARVRPFFSAIALDPSESKVILSGPIRQVMD